MAVGKQAYEQAINHIFLAYHYFGHLVYYLMNFFLVCFFQIRSFVLHPSFLFECSNVKTNAIIAKYTDFLIIGCFMQIWVPSHLPGNPSFYPFMSTANRPFRTSSYLSLSQAFTPMKNEFTSRQLALVAGGSLWAMAAVAGFAYGYLWPIFHLPASPEQSLAILQNAPGLLGGFLVAFTGVLLLDVVVAWALYGFLKPHAPESSLLMAAIRLVYAALLGIALLPLVQVNAGLTDGDATWIMLQLNSFLRMWSLGLVVFGAHLMLLGGILWKKTITPWWLAWLVVMAGACYSLVPMAKLLIPAHLASIERMESLLMIPMAVGELGLALWLLLKGGRNPILP
jgi:hypothetical protein